MKCHVMSSKFKNLGSVPKLIQKVSSKNTISKVFYMSFDYFRPFLCKKCVKSGKNVLKVAKTFFGGLGGSPIPLASA